jgi:hypothetical protein
VYRNEFDEEITASQKLLLQDELQQWLLDLEALLSNLAKSRTPINGDAVNLMRIHHRVISVWLSLSLSADEYETDLYTADFENIIILGEELTSKAGATSSQPQPEMFSFEMQIIAPLYYAAMKCRIPSMRRRAINLLSLAPRREGLWNAHIAMKIAERIMHLEEKDLQNTGKLCSNPGSIDDMLVPAEHSRIHLVGELPAEFDCFIEGCHKGSYMPPCSVPHRIEVVFQSKPWGLDGPWHVINEKIDL